MAAEKDGVLTLVTMQHLATEIDLSPDGVSEHPIIGAQFVEAGQEVLEQLLTPWIRRESADHGQDALHADREPLPFCDGRVLDIDVVRRSRRDARVAPIRVNLLDVRDDGVAGDVHDGLRHRGDKETIPHVVHRIRDELLTSGRLAFRPETLDKFLLEPLCAATSREDGYVVGVQALVNQHLHRDIRALDEWCIIGKLVGHVLEALLRTPEDLAHHLRRRQE